MHALQKIKDSPNYPRLKDSVEYRFRRKEFLMSAGWSGGAMLLMALVFLPLLGHSDDANVVAAMGMVFLLLFFLSFIAVYGYLWLELFMYIDSYTFCEVMLNRPHLNGRYGASFTVEVTDRHGKKLTRETGKIFYSYGELQFEEYNNQQVLVGYNEETDRLVVIHRLGRENGKL